MSFDLKKYLQNNPLLEKDFKFTDQEFDPVTRSLSSTVKYLPNFKKAYDDLEDAKNSISNVAGKDELMSDTQLKRIKDIVKDAFNKYRTHLRSNYKDEYTRIRGRGGVDELSTTGGSSTFTPGTGMQYATPFAFNKNKKAKGTNRDAYISQLGYKPVNK